MWARHWTSPEWVALFYIKRAVGRFDRQARRCKKILMFERPLKDLPRLKIKIKRPVDPKNWFITHLSHNELLKIHEPVPQCLKLISFWALFPLNGVSQRNPKIWLDNTPVRPLKPPPGGMMEWKVRDPEVLCAVFTVQHYKDGQLDPCCFYRQTLLIFLCCRTQRATGIPDRPAREKNSHCQSQYPLKGPDS